MVMSRAKRGSAARQRRKAAKLAESA